MDQVEDKASKVNWVGFEWDDAVEQAARLGVHLVKEVTSPPRGAGEGTQRVVRQRVLAGRVICTCAAEDWGETRC